METDNRPAISLSAFVGKEIRKLLIDLDMKQLELATRLGENEMWVSRRLRGTQPIDLNDLERIAAILEVDVAELLPREGRVVTHAGASRRQFTVPKVGLPQRPHTFGPANRNAPTTSTRRPVRITAAAA